MSRPSVSRAMNLRKTSRRDILRAMGLVAGASAVGAVVGGPSAAEVIRESTAPEGHAPVGLRLHGHPAPARTHGWSWKLPPNLVRPNSGLRNNIFYVGQPVTFKLGPSARTYEVRDYFGEIVDHGPAGLDRRAGTRQHPAMLVGRTGGGGGAGRTGDGRDGCGVRLLLG